MRANPVTTILSIVTLTYGGISTIACQRSNKNAAPAAQIQTQSAPQTVNQPVTVTGCLLSVERPPGQGPARTGLVIMWKQ